VESLNIAIDVGTGYVKGVKGMNEEGKQVIFSSHVAPATDLVLADFGNGDGGYTSVIKLMGSRSDSEKYFIGDLAIREGRNPGFNLEREKYLHIDHTVLLLTAARLLLGDVQQSDPLNLAIGLPIGYYKRYKGELRNNLQDLSACVSVNNLDSLMLEFDKVYVYPQGVGALFTLAQDLPDTGLVGVVDPGCGTTEYLAIEIKNGKAYPVSSLSGSVEIGTYAIYQSVADEYQSVSGGVMSLARANQVVRDGKGKAFYRGNEIDLTAAIAKARMETAKSIADGILSTWKNIHDMMRKVYLAGGGALEMRSLTDFFPAAVILADPQWANVRGYISTMDAISEGATP
jgi:plasmid segregation protein ParM